MTDRPDYEITQILNDLTGAEDDTTLAALLPVVYQELRALSEAYLRQERPDHTLQATALVHEVYVRLAKGQGSAWQDRAHFFRAAAKTMRRILINHALGHKAQKRGGGQRGVSLYETALLQSDRDFDLIALNEALERLSKIDPEKGKVVELRFFAGCTIAQTAECLDISTATVERHWRFARAWLLGELSDAE